MNLDKKLELAHEWAMEFVSKNKDISCASNMVSYNAWQYADAMEAEYNKRKQAKAKKDAEDAKVFFDKLIVADSPQLGFQVDWSFAPKEALTWAINSQGEATWANYDKDGNYLETIYAPSFNYQGDWKDSLRKRP